MNDLSGTTIKGYVLHAKVAEGGFGAVYYAFQPLVTTASREVAVKVIRPQFATIPSFVRRFDAEAQIVARLEHPHIVPLYDYWRDESGAYLVMRWMPGGSLGDVLSQGRLSLDAVIRVVEQIAAALAYAHKRGVVHRDLKPANILFDTEGNAYLADFGIASGQDLVVGTPLSEARACTPGYAAPEQIHFAPATPQSDIYSLGVVLYELLTGVPAFQGPTPGDIVQQQLTGILPSVHNRCPDLPTALDAIILHATAHEPDERYADALQVATAVRQACLSAADQQFVTEQHQEHGAQDIQDNAIDVQRPPARKITVSRHRWAQQWPAYMSLVVLTVLILALAGPPADKISWLPLHLMAPGKPCSQGQMLFASNRDGDFEIYAMNPDGSDIRQLTNNADRDILPRWSPDHSQILFVSNRDGQGEDRGDLYVMDANGQHVTRLTTEGGDDPAWSPDGRHIAFSSDRDGDYEIYVMDADGTDVRRLTANNVWDARPSWSPDGRNIVYSSRASGTYAKGPWDLHVVNSDGTDNTTIVSDGSRNTRPVWSPDGAQIAYVTDRHTNWEIYTVDPDEQNLKRLTNDVAEDVEVAWSPDSQCLAFVRVHTADNRDIYLIDTNGDNLRRITEHPQSDWYIFWSEAAR